MVYWARLIPPFPSSCVTCVSQLRPVRLPDVILSRACLFHLWHALSHNIDPKCASSTHNRFLPSFYESRYPPGGDRLAKYGPLNGTADSYIRWRSSWLRLNSFTRTSSVVNVAPLIISSRYGNPDWGIWCLFRLPSLIHESVTRNHRMARAFLFLFLFLVGKLNMWWRLILRRPLCLWTVQSTIGYEA